MSQIHLHEIALHAAGEGQDLLDELRAVQGAFFDVAQEIEPVRIRLVGPEQLDGNQDRREHVVEIVSDAAGQGADTLEALGAEELGLQFLFLGDVRVDDENRLRLPAIVAHQGPTRGDGQLAAVALIMVKFTMPFAVLQRRGRRRQKGSFVAVQLQFRHAATDRLDGSPTVEPLGTLVPVGDPMPEITHLDRILRLVQQRGLFE